MLRKFWNAIRTSKTNPQGDGRLMFVGPNSTGLFVDEDVAFSVSVVWACIDLIASSLASSDWNVYQGRRGANDQILAPDDGVHYVLNTRPNPEMTAMRAKRAIMMAALGWGNGWAEIGRDLSGRVTELWPIEPKRAELRRYADTGELYLSVTNEYGSGTVDLLMRDVLHIGGPGLTGLLGDKPIARAVRTIALALAQERFAETYFGNNTQVGGWLEVPTQLGDQAFERLKEQLNAGHKGVKKAFKFAIFEGGAKWHAAETNAEDAQMIEARHLQIEEICRWFHVPPHKIGHLLRSTNNNIEHQGLEFSRETLRPWKVEIEQECDYKLFSARGARRFVEIDLDWASEGDFRSRMQGYQIGRAMGVYSVNDVLRKLRENTIGPEGDVRTMNGASVRLEDVGKNMVPSTLTDDAEPEDDAESEDDETMARAWLQSIYSRVARMRDGREQDKHRAGRAGWREEARAEAEQYAERLVREVPLGGKLQVAAIRAGKDVAAGADPAVAAWAVFSGDE